MSTVAVYGIVPGDESAIHDEPHIEGSRITVRHVRARVEDGDLDAATLADRHALDLADVYAALAYYHNNPAEMRRVEEHRERVIDDHRERAITEPDDLE